ncbi:MAG TPA: MFS transporter [Bryobacteraceae bacterium]|jgi:fucose permease|nr:MFS transporter [Bryobacteraceae bacterium]
MLILAAILAIFVYGMIAAMLGTILPDLSARFHLTPSQLGQIAFTQALGLIIASIGVGPLIDNEGKKVGLVLGLLLITLALFALPQSKGFGSISIYLFLLGLGGGIIVTAANALVSDISPARRGTTLNLLNLFFGLGGLATPFLSANLMKRNPFRLCYTVAALTAATLVVNILTPMPPPSGARSFDFSDVGPVLGKPVLFLLALFLFLYVACEVGVWNWLAQHLIAQGIPESRALNILSLGFALGLLIGRVAVSPILISVPAPLVTLAAAVLMTVTTFLMLKTSNPTVAGVLVFLAGVSMAPVFPTTLAMVGDAFPRMTGTAMGVVITLGWCGLAVSSRIIGAIGGGDPKRLKKALLLIPSASAIMVVVAVAIRPMLAVAAH